MKRRLLLFALAFLVAGVAYAAPKLYKYRCPKCGLVQEYDRSGTRKCPNDGRTMIRVY
jgi:hypothetical protein